MHKDWVNAAAMALIVALVPNFVQWLVFFNEGEGRLAIVSLIAVGAASIAPLTLGRSWMRPGVKSVHRYYPVVLAAAGILASGYFVAVTGFGTTRGLGAGIAEILDSSLAPIFYILLVWWAGRQHPSGRILVSGGLILIGLTMVGFSVVRESELPTSSSLAWAEIDVILMIFGILGALGTSVGLWCIRKLVYEYDVGLGIAIMFRYMGAALVCFIAAMINGDGIKVGVSGFYVVVIAVCGGALLINLAYVMALRISSEFRQAGALAVVPLFALVIEGTLHFWISMPSRIPFTSVLLWFSVSVVTFGIWRLHKATAPDRVC